MLFVFFTEPHCSVILLCFSVPPAWIRTLKAFYLVHCTVDCPVQFICPEASYCELSQWHEAHEVVPHTADVLQKMLQLLGAHGCRLDAELHTPGDAKHFHHTWERINTVTIYEKKKKLKRCFIALFDPFSRHIMFSAALWHACHWQLIKSRGTQWGSRTLSIQHKPSQHTAI